jgi:phosphodiesterase/alkaline phosphatase D-like protein
MEMKTLFRWFLPAVLFFALFAIGSTRMSGQNGQTLRITNGPVMEEVASDTATIAWSTNMDGSTNVMYGTDPRHLGQLAEAPWGANGHTHRVKIRNLQPNTTYYFRIETGQARGGHGQEVESYSLRSFTTTPRGAEPLRDVAPRIQ